MAEVLTINNMPVANDANTVGTAGQAFTIPIGTTGNVITKIVLDIFFGYINICVYIWDIFLYPNLNN